MKRDALNSRRSIFTLAIAAFATVTSLSAQDANFHNAPADAAAATNSHTSQSDIDAGKGVFQQRCAACHGPTAREPETSRRWPTGPTQTAKPGEVFWYITKGDLSNGMPSWATLPEEQRWQVVQLPEVSGRPERQASDSRRRQRCSSRCGEHGQVRRSGSEGSLHRLPLRGAGQGPQDYGGRSSAAVRDRIGGQ